MKKTINNVIVTITLFMSFFLSILDGQYVSADSEKVISIVQPKVDPHAEVQFKDSNLEKLMIEEYGDGKRVTENDLSRVYRLSLSDVKSLEGLEKAHKMKELTIEDSPIEDFAPIENLWQLTNLKLQNTNLKSMSQIENVGKTVRQGVYGHHLYLINNTQLDDLETIQVWKTISSLTLKGNKVKELLPILDLPELKYVYIEEEHLGSNAKEVLRDLKRKGVSVRANIELNSPDDVYFKSKILEDAIRKKLNLSSSTPITESHLLSIQDLDISNMNIDSLEGLQYAKNLKKLNLNNTNISYLDVLGKLEHLEELSVSATSLSRLDFNMYPNLKKVDLSNNGYMTLNYIEEAFKVYELNMSKSRIYRLADLANFPSLKRLNLKGNYYTKVEQDTIKQLKAKNIDIELSSIDSLVEKDVKIYIKSDYSKILPLTKVDQIELSIPQYVNWANIEPLSLHDVRVQQDSKGAYILIPKLKLSEDYRVSMLINDYLAEQTLAITQNEVTFTFEEPKPLEPEKIIGKLLDYRGNPVVNQKIKFADTADQHRYVYTDENGNFEYELRYEKLLDIRIEGTFYDLPLKRLKVEDEKSDDGVINLGTFQFTEKYDVHRIIGRVINEDGEGINHFDVQTEALNHHSIKVTSSNWKDGHFTVSDLLKDEYKLTIFGAWGYRKKVLYVTPSEDLQTIVLSKKLPGVFEQGNNRITASKQDVLQGQAVQYQVEYENTSNEVISDVEIKIDGLYLFEVVRDSYRLNQKPIEVGYDERVFIGDLQPKEKGVLTFEAINRELEVGEKREVTAVISSGDAETVSLQTDVFNPGVTLNAPEITADKEITLYGRASANATVKIYANDREVATATSNDRYWTSKISLPVRNNNDTVSLYAKVVKEDQEYISEKSTVKYSTDMPKTKEFFAQVGEVVIEPNPYFGVATSGIVVLPGTEEPAQKMKFSVKFDREIDSASLQFLGNRYSLEKVNDTYRGEIRGDWEAYDDQLVELHIVAGGKEYLIPFLQLTILIDPSGYVFEGSMENRLSRVQTVVEEMNNQKWTTWNAAQYGQVNPQLTDGNGQYGWDVPMGDWRVLFTKDGYHPYTSRVVPVPPPEMELNVPLISKEPLQVQATKQEDETILFEFNRPVDEKTIQSAITVQDAQNKEIAGTFELQNWAGYKETTPGYFEPDSTQSLSKTIVWKPKGQQSSDYHVVVTTQLKDYRGEALSSKYQEILKGHTSEKEYAKDHVFQIYLNGDFDLKEAERYVEVRDAKNDKVEITLQKVNQSLMVRPSNGEYAPGQYTIIVHEDFKNIAGVKLSEAMNFTFTIKK